KSTARRTRTAPPGPARWTPRSGRSGASAAWTWSWSTTRCGPSPPARMPWAKRWRASRPTAGTDPPRAPGTWSAGAWTATSSRRRRWPLSMPSTSCSRRAGSTWPRRRRRLKRQAAGCERAAAPEREPSRRHRRKKALGRGMPPEGFVRLGPFTSPRLRRAASRHVIVSIEDNAHRAFGGAGGHGGVGLERVAHLARPGLGRLPAFLVLLLAAAGQLFVAHVQVDPAVGDVDLDEVAVPHQADGAAFGRFRGDVADGKPRCPAGEPAVGDQGAQFAEAFRLEVAGGIEHLLHARAAPRAFVADNDHVAGLHFAAQDARDGVLLALVDPGRAFKDEDRLVDARRLDDAAVLREVAVEHGEAPVPGVGVLHVPDDALFPVQVQAVPPAVLAE